MTNTCSQNPESSHPKSCVFLCLFDVFYVTANFLRRREQDVETSHRKWISQHLGVESLAVKWKDQREREHVRPLLQSALMWIWVERRSSVVHRGGWVVQFADKLPFREAWEDLRAFSARLWVGVFPVWWCSSALRISSSLVSDSSHLFLSRNGVRSLTRV